MQYYPDCTANHYAVGSECDHLGFVSRHLAIQFTMVLYLYKLMQEGIHRPGV